MTVEREDAGLSETFAVFFVICDHCGERVMLDADTETEASEEVEEMGWIAHKPEKVRFANNDRPYSSVYAEHSCEDCQ